MTFPVFIKAGRKKISVAREVREVNRLRMAFEKSMTNGVYEAFKSTGELAASNYEATGEIGDIQNVLSAKLEMVFRAHYEEVIDAFSQRVYDQRKFTPFIDLVNRFYLREGAEKVTRISTYTRRLILSAILLGERDGLGVSSIAALIFEKTAGAMGRSRAATIARTETHAAASWATDQASRELGLPNQRKRWVTVQDGRSRQHHAAANGQEVGIDEPFIIRYEGQEIRMMHPHDGSGGAANNVNCRCLAVYFSSVDDIFADFENNL